MQVALNIEILSTNHCTFELPIGFSARLHARLEQEIRGGGAPNSGVAAQCVLERLRMVRLSRASTPQFSNLEDRDDRRGR